MPHPASVRPALAVLALLCAASAPAPSAAQQDFRWSGPLQEGQRVEVKGVVGSIRAEPANGREVEVTAVVHPGRRGNADEVRIERVMHDGGVTLCAIYPSSRRNTRNECTPGDEWRNAANNQDTRVEFVVHVPRGVHFLGQTVNGSVEARSMPADASAYTVNGPVTVSAAGTVEASTVNGDIDATMGRADPGRDLAFHTVNGDITLRVPPDFGARLRASLLNGQIGGDFPIEVSRTGFVGRRGEGQIGRGGHELRLRTVNGDLTLLSAGRR